MATSIANQWHKKHAPKHSMVTSNSKQWHQRIGLIIPGQKTIILKGKSNCITIQKATPFENLRQKRTSPIHVNLFWALFQRKGRWGAGSQRVTSQFSVCSSRRQKGGGCKHFGDVFQHLIGYRRATQRETHTSMQTWTCTCHQQVSPCTNMHFFSIAVFSTIEV